MEETNGRQIVRARQSRLGRYVEPAEGGDLMMGSGGAAAYAGADAPPQQGLLEILWRRRWVVTLTTLACLVAAFVYVMKATPIYRSSARLYVEQTGPKILSDGLNGPSRQSDSYLYTQAELLKSTPIVSQAIDKAGAQKMRTFADVDNVLIAAKKSLEVEVGKKDDILTVSFDSAYPDEAALLVNEVVQAFVKHHESKQRSTAMEVLKILQKEKLQRDQELSSKLQEMIKFKEDNGALSFEYDKGNVITQRLSRLSDALNQAQMAAIDAKAAYEAAKAMAGDPVQLREMIEAEHAKSGVITALEREEADTRSQMHKMEWQLGVYQQNYGPDHPMVRIVSQAVLSLRAQCGKFTERYVDAYLASSKQTWDIAAQKEREVNKLFEQQQKEALSLNTQSARYQKLESELKRMERMCEILDNRIKELKVTEDTGAMNISQLEVARAEDKAVKPQKVRILAIALVLGLMLGTGLGLVRDWTDQRLRGADEIRNLLGLPVLGIVPLVGSRGRDRGNFGQSVALEPMGEVAEAYRTIRTAVYFGAPEGGSKRILVTSPLPGDGKSTMISNLAIAMAQAGQRIVLLDCDFRKPTQHRIFGLNAEVGLSSVVAGRAKFDEACQHTTVPNLDVLPCGPIPPNPAELLNSEAFADLLDKLAEQYDHVLIDSPPVMAVTDARILGAICDLTILVLRAEKSTRNISLGARDGLVSVGAQILGTVVNGVPRNRGKYGAYSGYGYYRYGNYGSQGRGGSNGHDRLTAGNGRGVPVLEARSATNGNGNGHGNGIGHGKAAAAVVTPAGIAADDEN
jgi:capsular exopolysaccharide synthesis family protein